MIDYILEELYYFCFKRVRRFHDFYFWAFLKLMLLRTSRKHRKRGNDELADKYLQQFFLGN